MSRYCKFSDSKWVLRVHLDLPLRNNTKDSVFVVGLLPRTLAKGLREEMSREDWGVSISRPKQDSGALLTLTKKPPQTPPF